MIKMIATTIITPYALVNLALAAVRTKMSCINTSENENGNSNKHEYQDR